MKKLFFSILIICAGFLTPALAQDPQMPSLVGTTGIPKNLFDYKLEMSTYFDQLVILSGPEILEEEGGDYAQYKRWLAYWEPRLTPGGDFVAYYESQRDAYEDEAMGGGERSNTDPWHEIGPKRKPEQGQQIGVGPTHFVTFNPSNPEMMLTGAFEGGLFYSADGGESWVNAGSDANWTYSGCGWAEFSPANQNVWYGSNTARTTEIHFHPFIGFINGIWRTTTAGNTWELIGDYQDFNGPWTRIASFHVDPNNANVMYVATSDGIYKTNNLNLASPTWQKIYPSSGGATVFDLEIKSNATNVIYATAQTAGVWEVIVSTDNGATWSPIASQPAAPANVVSYTIEQTEANPDLLYVLHVVNSGSANLCPLYTYNANSGVWSLRSTSLKIYMGRGHGWGVSNFDEDIVYMADEIFYKKSVDGGQTWTTYYNLTHSDVEDIITPPASCTTCTNEVWMCNHGGISKSTNSGVSWTDKSEGLGVALTFGFSASETDPDAILVGLYHDGSAITKTTYTPGWITEWSSVYGGDGQIPLIDYDNSDRIWISYNNPSATYRVSSNAGASFTGIPARGDWYCNIAQNSQTPSVVYGKRITSTHTEDIFRFTNYGTGSYEQITDFDNLFSGLGYCWPIQWQSAPTNPNVLYVNMHQELTGGPTISHLLRTTNAQAAAGTVLSSWYDLQVPRNAWAADIQVDPDNSNIVYFVYSGYQFDNVNPSGGMVYKADYTNPLSAVIEDWTYNLVPQGVCALALEKGSNGGIYIVTDRGVFYTNNKYRQTPATAWRMLGDVPHVGASGVSINYEVNKIRVGLFGRGVWEHDLYCPEDDNLTYSSTHSTDLFAEARLTITSTAIVPSPRKVTYRAGQSIDLNPGFQAQPGAVFLAFIHPCDDFGNSFRMQPEEEFADQETSELTDGTENTFELFPNPTSGRFTLEKGSDELATVDVFDLYGRTVFEKQQMTGNKMELDLSGQQAGIYLIRVITPTETKIIRLVKQ